MRTSSKPGRIPANRDSMRGRIRSLFSFQGRYRILHLTWFAFFLSFVVWFNFAPFAGTIGTQFGLSKEQLTVLALCNVALTVPARVLVGMALDRWGPRRVYATILIYAAVPCLVFATASSFTTLVIGRLGLSLVGAGFVVGIRMVSEWFPPREVGTAEGVYGGWGNFGSAAAAFSLPALAALIGGANGWRWATAATGVVAAAYGLLYLKAVRDTPDGAAFARPRRQGALEVTQPAAVWGLLALNAPLAGVLVLVAWRLTHVGFLSARGLGITAAVIVLVLAVQTRAILRVNQPARANTYPDQDRYPLRSVAVLCLAYAVSFGSELAVVSMLPGFFASTFALSPVAAGMTASAFAFMNLAARPAGGLLSDLLGNRRRTLAILLLGLGLGYGLMASIRPTWPLALAVVAAMACSFFVQAAEGATYAVVPLIKRRVSGQISGMVGAYGNVGALLFLTVLLFAGPTVFFIVIAVSASLGWFASRWLVEPPDGFSATHIDDIAVETVLTPPGVIELPA